MRIIFAVQLYFYFVWAYGSENLVQWSLYAFLMWVAGYYLHQYNWEKRKSFRMALRAAAIMSVMWAKPPFP